MPRSYEHNIPTPQLRHRSHLKCFHAFLLYSCIECFTTLLGGTPGPQHGETLTRMHTRNSTPGTRARQLYWPRNEVATMVVHVTYNAPSILTRRDFRDPPSWMAFSRFPSLSTSDIPAKTIHQLTTHHLLCYRSPIMATSITSPQSPLMRLPTELIRQIGSHLDLNNKLAMAVLCRRFHSIMGSELFRTLSVPCAPCIMGGTYEGEDMAYKELSERLSLRFVR